MKKHSLFFVRSGYYLPYALVFLLGVLVLACMVLPLVRAAEEEDTGFVDEAYIRSQILKYEAMRGASWEAADQLSSQVQWLCDLAYKEYQGSQRRYVLSQEEYARDGTAPDL